MDPTEEFKSVHKIETILTEFGPVVSSNVDYVDSLDSLVSDDLLESLDSLDSLDSTLSPLPLPLLSLSLSLSLRRVYCVKN